MAMGGTTKAAGTKRKAVDPPSKKKAAESSSDESSSDEEEIKVVAKKETPAKAPASAGKKAAKKVRLERSPPNHITLSLEYLYSISYHVVSSRWPPFVGLCARQNIHACVPFPRCRVSHDIFADPIRTWH